MKNGSPTFRVGISGSYGGLNLGDEAILHSIITQLRESLPAEVTVFSRDPKDTQRRHDVRAVPVRQLTRDESRAEVEKLDLLILGGGGILFDAEAEIYLREVQLAHEVGVPVMVYAISAGPLTTSPARKLVRETLKDVAVLTVRDRQGKRLLEEVGVHRDIEVTADPALLLQPEPLPEDALVREGLEGQRRRVGFSVREPGPAAPDMDEGHYHALIANAADYMIDRLNADVVFVPMERGVQDMQHSHAVIALMQNPQRATVLKGEYTPRQVLSLMGHFEFAVGMRLHFLIFSAIAGKPFVALPYASKVTGLLEDFDMEMPTLHQVTIGRLLARIDRSWDMQNQITSKIQKALPEVQQRARRNNELAVGLLRERGGRSKEGSDAAAGPTRAAAVDHAAAP